MAEAQAQTAPVTKDPVDATVATEKTEANSTVTEPNATEKKESETTASEVQANGTPQVKASSHEESKPAEELKDSTKTANTSTTDDADQPKKSVEPSDKQGTSNGTRPHQKKKNRSKADFSQLPESSDPNEIRRQVEYYFSDSNLPQDKFLFNSIEGCNNKPIAIKTVADFGRMRRFKPYEAVVEALRESTVIEVLEGEQIRRKEPLAEVFGTKMEAKAPSGKAAQAWTDKTVPRSIYAKGFGHNETATMQIDIEKFFEPYGAISVRLRRGNDRGFKGSVFVEFKDVEGQEAFLAMDPKPTYQGAELLIKSKKQYCDEKVEEKIAKGEMSRDDVNHNNRKSNDRGGRNSRGNNRGGRGDRQGRGRGRGRGGRGRDDRGPRRGSDAGMPKQDKKDDIPKATSESVQKTNASQKEAPSKKRSAEGDVAPETEVKKAKSS